MTVIGFIILALVVIWWVDRLNGHEEVNLSSFNFIENEEIYRKECEASGEQWVRPYERAPGRPNADWGKEFRK
jgi:hypothetical protein